MTTNKPSSTRFLLVCLLIIVSSRILPAQDVGLGLSTTSDENIFDTYDPMKDQVTQLSFDLSKGWDIDNIYLGVFYSGSLLLYKNLPARDYNLHMAMASLNYHFVQDEETDEYQAEEDSLEAESDSTAETVTIETTHPDSLDCFLSASLIAAAQFNKVDYEEWDNVTAGGAFIFRQPLGLHASIRPSYSLLYHNYPNLSALTNVQNLISLHIGTDFIEGNWFALTPTYGFESYTETNNISDTINFKKNIRGKQSDGADGLTKVVSLNLSTPSVQQFVLSLFWNYNPARSTELTTQITHYAAPSKEARAIPQLRRGTAKLKTFISGLDFGQSDLYDDHFSYSGTELTVQAKQALPVEMTLEVSLQYQRKTYTYEAMDLSDTVVVANNREDKRTEIAFNLSKSISLGDEKNLKLEFEYQFLNNGSNAPYYDFKKNIFIVGIEYSF